MGKQVTYVCIYIYLCKMYENKWIVEIYITSYNYVHGQVENV